MIQASKRIRLWLLAAVPSLLIFLLTMMFLVLRHTGAFSHFMPVLPLIPLFYWGMRQMQVVPYVWVALLGVMVDAVSGLPLGLTALAQIFFLFMVRGQRKHLHKEGFIIQWGFFALVLGLTELFTWGMLLAFYSHSPPVVPVVMQWLMTVCVYPLFHVVFDAVQHYLHARRWRIMHGM